MDFACKELCKNAQGAKFGYVQSDEISVLITDYDTLTTDAWFDYDQQKIVSVSASIVTKAFNQKISEYFSDIDSEANGKLKLAEFDARAWSMNEQEEVVNYSFGDRRMPQRTLFLHYLGRTFLISRSKRKTLRRNKKCFSLKRGSIGMM